MPVSSTVLPKYSHFPAVTVPCWTCAGGDWCKQIPDTRTSLNGAWVLPFKSSRKNLQWNYSACFLSMQRLWKGGTVPVSPPLAWGGVFIERELKSLGTYWANSLMGCWLIDWWLCLSRCCKSCSGVTLARIKDTPRYYAGRFVDLPMHKLVACTFLACSVAL